MTRALATLFAAALLVAALPAQDAERFVGHWQGRIKGAGLDIDVDLLHTGGDWSGDITIPAQGAHDLPLGDFALAAGRLRFTILDIAGDPTFDGALSDDGELMSGSFVQGAAALTFELRRTAAVEEQAKDRLADFGAWMERAREALDVVGCAVAVIREGKVVLLEGYGMRDREKSLPVTPDTLFAIGSSTKAFTTFALGQLVDEAKLDWDESVINYLPEFRLAEEYATAHATTRDLVCHRTGLPRHDLAWYNARSFDAATLPARLAHFEMNQELRQSFQYNNLLFVTAGQIVARLRKTTWEDAIREHVLEPLAMKRTTFSVAKSQEDPDHAVPYQWRDKALARIPFRDISPVGPAGSINSSAGEMLAWLRVHLDGGKIEGRQLIESTTLAGIHAPHVVIGGLPTNPKDAPMSYALGWMVDAHRGHLRIHHGGNIDGFSALVTLYPHDRTGIVVLCNGDGSPLPGLASERLADLLFDDQSDADPLVEAATALKQLRSMQHEGRAQEGSLRRRDTSPSHPLGEYAGAFRHPGYGELRVDLVDEGLTLVYNDIPTRLEHWHFDVFAGHPEGEDRTFDRMKFQFHSNEDGEIQSVTARFEPSVAPIRFEREPDASLFDAGYLARFVGHYLLPGQVAEVAVRGNRLTLDVPPQPLYTLEPERANHFRLVELDGYRVVFKLDDQGQAKEVLFRQPNGTFLATRRPSDAKPEEE